MAPPIFTLVEDGDGKFVIVDNAIKLAAPLNYDVAPSHRVTVAVSGVTPAVANKTFTITVIDIDPVISLSETSVLETAPVGTFVGNLSVSDVTGIPVYTLVDSAGGKFAIDGNTLEVAGPLDFATSAYHSITVAASGFTPTAENRTFTISVLQAESVITLSSLSIPENITNGTTIGTLSVLGGTGTYTFTIVSDPDGLFTVDSEDLDKVGIVDYETSTSHEVTIQADNGAGDVVTQTLTITVTNVVDTAAPVALSFSPRDNALFADVAADLVVTLDGPVSLGTGNIHLKKTSDDTVVETWDVVADAGSTAGKVEVVDINKLTMHRTTDMPEEELYVVWDAGVVTNFDTGIAALSSTTAWSFTVEALPWATTLAPGAVYAFRKLVAAYAGDCVRIRASGDDVEDDFGFVDGEVDIAGIAAFITTHGGSPFIVTQYDQSGNGIDVTQATPANQPAFIASGMNGKPVARFDGSNDTLLSAPITGATLTNVDETTFMGVMKQNGATAQNALFAWPGGIGNTYDLQATYDNIFYFNFPDPGGYISANQSTGWDDNSHIIEGYRTVAGTQELIVDGNSLISASRTGVITAGSFPLYVGSNGSTYLGGDIAELVILKTDIGSTMRAVLRERMNVRYSIIA